MPFKIEVPPAEPANDSESESDYSEVSDNEPTLADPVEPQSDVQRVVDLDYAPVTEVLEDTPASAAMVKAAEGLQEWWKKLQTRRENKHGPPITPFIQCQLDLIKQIRQWEGRPQPYVHFLIVNFPYYHLVLNAVVDESNITKERVSSVKFFSQRFIKLMQLSFQLAKKLQSRDFDEDHYFETMTKIK